ncbi:MAG: amidohydrolase [Clostridia bacterium]|nr:amidohydrolase [Clostridia bacterium]
MIRKEIHEIVNRSAKEFEQISDQVWEFAETCFEENQSSALQSAYLEKRGFRVKTGVSNMPTAFIAEWGSGAPVIAILGENDALASLSQEADLAVCTPITAGAPGHGCGHNLLGTGGMEAACAVKEYLEANKLAGTIRYYGTPAEEGGGGKVYMVLDHQFDDVDACFVWHPSSSWDVTTKGLAIVSAYFKFEGIASHAAAADQGRSALDALELMNVGVNFLREHVRAGTLMHYSITNTGGPAANIVQQNAEGFYILRNESQAYLKELFARVEDVARGAALMTGTKFVGSQIISNYANINPNSVLDEVVLQNLKEILPLEYTEEEKAYGQQFVDIGTKKDVKTPYKSEATHGEAIICSDVCDVSWVTPLSHFFGVTLAQGTLGHSWMTVSQGKSSTAKKGMHAAAEVMANSAIDVIENPELIKKAKEAFKESLENNPPYETLMVNCDPKDYRQ